MPPPKDQVRTRRLTLDAGDTHARESARIVDESRRKNTRRLGVRRKTRVAKRRDGSSRNVSSRRAVISADAIIKRLHRDGRPPANPRSLVGEWLSLVEHLVRDTVEIH